MRIGFFSGYEDTVPYSLAGKYLNSHKLKRFARFVLKQQSLCGSQSLEKPAQTLPAASHGKQIQNKLPRPGCVAQSRMGKLGMGQRSDIYSNTIQLIRAPDEDALEGVQSRL